VDTNLHSSLREVFSPTVERLGYWVSAIELASDPRGLVVRLYIDGPGGVGIADCARVSRELSPVLDVEDPIPDNYNLEVSSPGIDRLIERPEDFNRFAGFRAKVRLQEGLEGRRRYSGDLVGLEGTDFLLQSGETTHRISLADVSTVRLNPSPEDYDRLRDVAQKPKESPDDQ
jgi:ribosome maturation factor RimP